MKWNRTALLTFSLIGVLTVFGCGNPTPEGGNSTAGESDHDHDHGDHDHPSEGPHHGTLIELGNEEYHAELVHDEETKQVTIYLLDSAVKESVSIPATEVTINISHDGMGEQFKLAAVPQDGDPEGTSSKFVSDDVHLAEDLDHEGSKATLVVTIDGKPYRSPIEHSHDDDHDHDHDKHEHKE